MGQRIKPHSAHHPHQGNDGGGAIWHPAGRSDITPMKAQILFACAGGDLSITHAPFLAMVLGSNAEMIETTLQTLIDNQLVLRCIMQPSDLFMPTPLGFDILNRIAARKPEILKATQDLFNLTPKGHFSCRVPGNI